LATYAQQALLFFSRHRRLSRILSSLPGAYARPGNPSTACTASFIIFQPLLQATLFLQTSLRETAGFVAIQGSIRSDKRVIDPQQPI